jgi:hypothetical protein
MIALPRVSLAQVDPTTVAEVIGAAIKVIQQIGDAKAEADWKAEITTRLFAIDAKLSEILTELKDLRVWMAAQEQDAQLRSFGAAVRGDIANIQEVLTSILNRRERKAKLVALADNIRRNLLAFINLRYTDPSGTYVLFAGYSTVSIGCVALLAASRFAGDRQYAKATITDCLHDFFVPAANVNQYRSFAWALNQSNDDAQKMKSELDGALKVGCVGYHAECTETGGGRPPPSFYSLPIVPKIEVGRTTGLLRQICTYTSRFVTLVGNADDGYSYSGLQDHPSGQLACEPVFPGHPPSSNDPPSDDLNADYIRNEYNRKAEARRQEKARGAKIADFLTDLKASTQQLQSMV